MQKKRPRSKDSTRDGSGATPPAVGAGKRTVRVRSRLVAGVAVVGITVIAAGAPMALGASADLNESQRLVTLAELNQQAITLAHALADERDEVVGYIAAGRDEEGGNDPADAAARVDRKVDEIGPDASASLRRDLSTIPSLRREALTGKGSATEAFQAYSEVIAKLHGLAGELAEKTPPRAADATRAPLALGGAVEQASATRGLLLAALAVPGTKPSAPEIDPYTGLPVRSQDESGSEESRTRDELSAAAQQARVRELASLAEFDQAAGPAARDRLASTVTGPEVNTAEKYLTRLTDRPELSDADRRSDPEKVEAALSARVDRMRSAESALGTAQVARLEKLRDDDVTALEIRLALLGGCLLIAVGVSTAVARTLTQPLAVLRLGAGRIAAEPETAEPVRYTGRNDEFAQVVRSINTLHGKLHGMRQGTTGRLETLEAEHGELTAAREELTTRRAELQAEVAELTKQLEQLKNTVHHTFVNLSLRTLGLVERQLAVIEGLEEREQDPERLATLFKLDHMATVMRRHSENMLVLAGTEHNQGHAGPIPLVDVLRAAVSEIERYERVTIQSLPPHAQIAGFAADDLSHLVAELLENATSFSPPDSHVELSGWLLETGEVMLSVQDEGIGMSAVRMSELNARLTDPASFEAGEQAADGAGLGLQVISLLAARHGVRVELREQKGNGVTAVVVLPQALLPKAPPAASPPAVQMPGDAPTLNLPGSVAEANSNALPPRSAAPDGDPMIAAAERTLREAGADTASADAESEAAEATEGAEGPAPAEASTAVPEADIAAPAAAAPEDVPAAADVSAVEDEVEDEVEDGGEEDAPAPAPVDDWPVPDGHQATPPAEPDPETTMQVRLPSPQSARDPYAIGPDRHERAADSSPAAPADPGAAPPASTASAALPGPRQPLTAPVDDDGPAAGFPGEGLGEEVPDPAPVPERLTDKGLPKRTPKIVAPPTAPATDRKGTLDKDALRRRLGGFHQGAMEGRRDVEAELAENTSETDETGDTVEEARS
ncbi:MULTISPECIES: nitrate- and nitrite sensing domain-containing protein [unclassified Streptomyces]|uniref:sensor histidine kinase n=2 Tax=unclassified Streptomyces TaxID=2593676 RepID=UPI0001C1C4BC|nr:MULTISPECIES: nitrate- and nitrite sensing domain-containing protein [unclassified Streptomyces]MYR67950.1 HAMP domain-containing protein [Streptomyces sp. SID4939]MYT63112.1 HAMP domain-containing protein [Streptomyces sp. SID8357]MYT88612.1 HAMP domain-containing protein [Streptomyces sp. SID8360]MYW39802.1 HAMP domain-containing protein [Streptomyces sp. SID1]AEN12348.1 integral membrane sensor signal transduction histidine kinase [Streptomyces sp. SirexAA-E]